MTTSVPVPLARTAAIREPSGDHVGNPYDPFAASDSRVCFPSASTIDSEPSVARTAREPVDAIGWSLLGDTVGAILAVAGEGLALAVSVEVELPDGTGPPHAATAAMIVTATMNRRDRSGHIA
jgi:hypothetical protein